MLTRFEADTQTALPEYSATVEPGIYSEPAEVYEAILARAEAKMLAHVPGKAVMAAAEPCRTWICECTRAVPHGSFL